MQRGIRSIASIGSGGEVEVTGWGCGGTAFPGLSFATSTECHYSGVWGIYGEFLSRQAPMGAEEAAVVNVLGKSDLPHVSSLTTLGGGCLEVGVSFGQQLITPPFEIP